MSERKEAVRAMAWRIRREVKPMTEHGDVVEFSELDADALAEIIAEYVDAAHPQESDSER